MEAIGILFMTFMLAWGIGVVVAQVEQADNKKKFIIALLIAIFYALLLASPLIYLVYNDIQQQKLNKKDNEMSPFKVYERCIDQFTYFVVCDTRLPYPQCIKAYHKNWYKAQDQCRELNMNAKEKTNQKGEKR